MEQANMKISTEVKKLSDGTEVSILGEVISIPQPDKIIDKKTLLNQQKFHQDRIESDQIELEKVNELLKIIG